MTKSSIGLPKAPPKGMYAEVWKIGAIDSASHAKRKSLKRGVDDSYMYHQG